MKRSPIALALSALLAAGACLSDDAKTTAAAPAPTEAQVNIGTINGVAYPLDLFRIFFAERLQETGHENDQAFQQQAFNEFMSMVVASQEAERLKLQDKPEVAAAIELQRLKVMSNAALASMAQEIQVSEDDLKNAYEQVKKQASRTEYKASHILVKDEAEAKKIIKQLDKKADFAELAKKYSLGPTGKNGGELDWFDGSQMVKPFADAVAQMKPGTYSKEPVQTQFGWHVIKLEDTRKAAPPSFEDAKPQLTAIVQRQKLGERLAKLRDSAMVDLNKDVVKVRPKEDEGAASEDKPADSKDAEKK